MKTKVNIGEIDLTNLKGRLTNMDIYNMLITRIVSLDRSIKQKTKKQERLLSDIFTAIDYIGNNSIDNNGYQSNYFTENYDTNDLEFKKDEAK